MFKGFVSCSNDQIVVLNSQSIKDLLEEMPNVPKALDGIIIGDDKRVACLIDLTSSPMKIKWNAKTLILSMFFDILRR